MMEEMKSCRAEMGSMIADLKEKQQRAQQLAEEMAKLPKNINRTVYTHRIMDIIDRINKQSRYVCVHMQLRKIVLDRTSSLMWFEC